MSTPDSQIPEMPSKGNDPLNRILDYLKQFFAAWFSESPHLKQILPYSKDGLAKERANERRQSIRSTLSDIGDSRFLRREFIEIPPSFPIVERRALADNVPEAIGQTVRLRWQLDTDELLLIERVVDAIVLLKRTERNLFADEIPLIRLAPLRKSLVRKDYFPWKVVVETDHPMIYERFLYDIQDWLGIGVDTAPRRKIKPLGICQMPNGMEGTIGGMVAGADTYSVTCSHVLSPHCGSVRFRSQLNQDTDQPDSALLEEGNPCFSVHRGATRVLSAATKSVIDACIKTRAIVDKLQNPKKGAPGFVRTRVSTIPMQGFLFRFPHLEIKPNRMRQWGLKFPLFRKNFSVDGDSGAWVTDRGTGSWLGMVVCGADDHSSWVVEAEPLLRFFEDNLSTMGMPQKLTPIVYT
jgi:hypothetical protein